MQERDKIPWECSKEVALGKGGGEDVENADGGASLMGEMFPMEAMAVKDVETGVLVRMSKVRWIGFPKFTSRMTRIDVPPIT